MVWDEIDLTRGLWTLPAARTDGADVAVLDFLLNHASSATRGGVIGTYQRALLIEPSRRVMQLWNGLLRKALNQDNVIRLSV